jgi:WhiB family redox-sensing transcriptional regulator
MEVSPGEFVPYDPTLGLVNSLPDQATWVARQEVLASNFHNRIGALLGGEIEGVELRPHQPGVFQEFDDFFVETMHESGRSTIMPLPPNAGKSTMAAIIADMVGIGKSPAENQPPLTSVTLTPRRVARQQTEASYKQFSPTIRPLMYKGEHGPPEQQRPTDAWLLTYRAVTAMSERDWDYFCKVTDLLVLDEVHRAIGPQISARLQHIIDYRKPTIVAMSATPDFDEDRSSCKVLGIKRSLKPVTPRDAVEIGISNGVQLFALYSGETVKMTSKRDTVTENDLSGLIYNKSRNELIVDVMHERAEVGHPGIIQCIPGRGNPKIEGHSQGSAHAQEIASLACQRKITDLQTGKRRHMKVEAVGNFRTDRENDEIIAAFKRGEYDALTFTKLLNEAFDHPIKYLFVNLTTSMVEMGQTTGRGGRLHDAVTGIYCVVDKYESPSTKRLVTPFDIYGEECINQGATLGKPGIRARSPAKTPTGQKRPPRQAKDHENEASGGLFTHESTSVRDALEGIPAGTLLDELLLVRNEYSEVPERYIPLSSLPTVQRGLATENGARYTLSQRTNDRGEPLFISVRAGGRAQYVLPEAEEVLSKFYFDSSRQVTRLDVNSFLAGEGWPTPSFDVIVKVCKDIEAEYSISKKAMRFDPSEAEKVLRYLARIPLVDPSVEIALSDLAHALGYASSKSLHDAIRANPGLFEQFLRKRRKGVPHGAYKVLEAIELEAATDLVRVAIDSSPILRKRIGPIEPQTVVNETQLIARAAMWKRKLRPTLSEAAIENFIGQFSLRGLEQQVVVETSIDETTASQSKLDTVTTSSENTPAHAEPHALDESYRLSEYKESWSEHAACTQLDSVDSFFSNAPHHVIRAKRICQTCPVKGDCLLFDLEHPSSEIAGGFTSEERKGLPTQQLIEWLKTPGSPAS